MSLLTGQTSSDVEYLGNIFGLGMNMRLQWEWEWEKWFLDWRLHLSWEVSTYAPWVR